MFDPDNTYYGRAITISLEDVGSITLNDIDTDEDGDSVEGKTFVYLRVEHQQLVTDDNGYNSDNGYASSDVYNRTRWGIMVGNHLNNITPNILGYGDQTDDSNLGFTSTEEIWDSITSSGSDSGIVLSAWGLQDNYKLIKFGFFKTRTHPSSNQTEDIYPINTKLYHLFVVHSEVVGNINLRDYYVDVIGRIGATPYAYDIVDNILTDELEFNNTISPPTYQHGDWPLAFSVNKNINSKKLIEEILQSSPYYGYFKDDQFNLSPYPAPGEDEVWQGGYKEIDADHVLSYKYDRTPIEKVVTRCKVKYHYDYGIKDYTKETDWLLASEEYNDIDPPYSNNYYGIDDDQDLVFESKYIRTEGSALSLRNFLLRQYCNQHNLFTVKLPVSYYDYNLTDIVTFNKLIEGRKSFGEDYTALAVQRNGQACYGKFYVIGLKKTLDYIELKLYQIHDMSGEAVIVGCMESIANNYNPDANVAGECTYDPPEPNLGYCALPSGIEPNYEENDCLSQGGQWNTDGQALSNLYGCTDPEADNHTDGAIFDNGICQYTPVLGEFSVTNTESSWSFLELDEFPSAYITFEWNIPENAFYNQSQARFILALIDTTTNEYLISGLEVSFGEGTTSPFFVLDVSDYLSVDEVNVAHEYIFKVACININCDPNYEQASDFPFTITVESQEDIPDVPDLIIDTSADIKSIGYDIDIGLSDNTFEVVPSKELEIKFAVEANSPDIALNPDKSFMALRVKWDTLSPDTGDEGLVSLICKVQYNYSEQKGDGVYWIHFKSSEVYFVNWTKLDGIVPFEAQINQGNNAQYNTIIADTMSNHLSHILHYPNNKINTIIHYYRRNANENTWHLEGGKDDNYWEAEGDCRYMIITDVYIYDDNTGTGWRYDNTNTPWYEPDFPLTGDPSQRYVYTIPVADVDTEYQYDFDGSGVVEGTALTIINMFKLNVDEKYPNYNDYDHISINDSTVRVEDWEENLNDDGSNRNDLVISAADHNGEAPIGFYCKADLSSIVLKIYNIILGG